MRYLIIAVCVVMVFLSNTAIAQELSVKQKQYIHIYSQKYMGKYWRQWEKTMQAVMKVESNNCQKKVGELDASFGCGQTKVGAVRTAAKFWSIPIPQDDEKIIWKLLRDDEFAIRFSVAYMGYLRKRLNDWDLAVISYNLGEGRVIGLLKKGDGLPQDYIDKVKREMGRHGK